MKTYILHKSGARLKPRVSTEGVEFLIPDNATEEQIKQWAKFQQMDVRSLAHYLQANDPNGTFSYIDDMVEEAKASGHEDENLARYLTNDVPPFTNTGAGRRLALAFAYDNCFNAVGSDEPDVQYAFFDTIDGETYEENKREVEKIAQGYASDRGL